VSHKRKPVAGLTTADFRVLEDGQPVKITDASVDSRPLDVTVLLDVSESTALPWIRAHAGLVSAAGGVQRLLRGDDTLSMYRFSESLQRVTPESDTNVVHPRGQTALFDALLAALLHRPTSPRRVIIVLTDGLDTASTVPFEITRTVAERSDAALHVVALSLQTANWYFHAFAPVHGRGDFREFSRELQELATGTGGQFFTVDAPEEFLPALAEVLEQARSRYYLRFTPAKLTPGWHTLTVSTRTRDHQVTHRRGYWR
jgi:VWFA-related protein